MSPRIPGWSVASTCQYSHDRGDHRTWLNTFRLLNSPQVSSSSCNSKFLHRWLLPPWQARREGRAGKRREENSTYSLVSVKVLEHARVHFLFSTACEQTQCSPECSRGKWDWTSGLRKPPPKNGQCGRWTPAAALRSPLRHRTRPSDSGTHAPAALVKKLRSILTKNTQHSNFQAPRSKNKSMYICASKFIAYNASNTLLWWMMQNL